MALRYHFHSRLGIKIKMGYIILIRIIKQYSWKRTTVNKMRTMI